MTGWYGPRFYLATDERDPEAIKYLKNNGAILFKDVLSLEDRREFGWPLLLTDVVSLVEQQIMGKHFHTTHDVIMITLLW